MRQSTSCSSNALNIGTRTVGVERGFNFSELGELLSEQVLLNETPEAVRKTIEKETSGAVLVRIEKTTDDGETIFEVETRKAGIKRTFKVNPEGRVVED